ncbi:hypothetical protein pkur_cds_831 [Pandoravirus kuranda]|uniref:Uncharacterized protein n=1 Tax=Pandoravirus kuranda TaxID=3019033 RepID=A0AA95EDV2_9VIRU|nr:hypothetical protein pkur_cds_831 [Pandoravirus kuranda]
MPPSASEPLSYTASLLAALPPSSSVVPMSQSPTGVLPESYRDAVDALSVMGVGCLTGVSLRQPVKYGSANPLGVRGTISKPRALGNIAASGNSNMKRTDAGATKGVTHRMRPAFSLTTATSLYIDGAAVTMGWSRATPLPPPPDYGGSDAPLARDVCHTSCAKRLGAAGCAGLDPRDIEGSMRLRLATIEEAFENATARRFIASVEHAVASGSLGVFAIHRPLWSRPACLACTAANAPRRPPPIAIVPMAMRDGDDDGDGDDEPRVREHQEPPMPSPASSTMSSPDCAPIIAVAMPASKNANREPWSATVGIADRPHIKGVCVYVCGRSTSGGVAWTVRRRSHPPGARVVSSSASQSPSAHTKKATCARCAKGKRTQGAMPSVSSSTMPNAGGVPVPVSEVIGAVASNLAEGIAGVALSMDATQQCHPLWSGIPGQPLAAPTLALASTVAAPTTTWLATETKAVMCEASRRRPETGCEALYTCARLSYATARLADVAARQRAAHDYAGGVAQSDPRRVRAAVPVSYAPSIDSPAAALAWVRGAASAVGPAVDTDRALNRLVADYRMHVLARDLEQFPLDPIDPARLPDEVRVLARHLQALVRSPAEPPDLSL